MNTKSYLIWFVTIKVKLDSIYSNILPLPPFPLNLHKLKMKLLPLPLSLFRPKEWPLCTQQPRTSSFHITTMKDDDLFKTINSIYFDPENDAVETPDSWFTNSSDSTSLSSLEYDDNSNLLEDIVRGAQQDNRVLFDPNESDSPKLIVETTRFEKSVAISVDSEDPYQDFRVSMEEMVENLGMVDDWDGLEELLRWYLKVNRKDNHEFIINAFVDLVHDFIAKTSRDDHHDDHDDAQISKSSTYFSSAASSLSLAST